MILFSVQMMAELPTQDDYKNKKELLLKKVFSLQSADGAIRSPFESDPSVDAIFLVLLKRLGYYEPQVEKESLKKIFDWKGTNDYWPVTIGGDPSLDNTGIILLCLKDLGLDKKYPELKKVEAWFNSKGGTAKFNFGSMLLLAPLEIMQPLFMKMLTPSILDLPDFVPGSIAHQGVLRSITVPLITWKYFWTKNHSSYLGQYFNLGNDESATRGLDWTLAHQQADGDTYMFYNAVVTLLAMNEAKKAGVYGPRLTFAIKKGVEALLRRRVQRGPHVVQQVFYSTGWDTPHFLMALNEDEKFLENFPEYKDAYNRGVDFLLKTQILVKGDWSLQLPNVVPGGWVFDAKNTDYPDTDVTTAALEVLLPQLSNSKEARISFLKGLKWLLAHQNEDGGFPAEEINVSETFFRMLKKIDPNISDFSDLSESDITARIIRLIYKAKTATRYKIFIDDQVIKNACQFIMDHSVDDKKIIWKGRWLVGYFYGTSEVISALLETKCARLADVEKSLDWLVTQMNFDGGFGESNASFMLHRPIKGKSTVMQTGYIIQSFITYETQYLKENAIHSKYWPKIQEMMNYLLSQVQVDGTIDEKSFTGVVANRLWYTDYSFEPYTMTIMAIHRMEKLFL